jgi:DNA-binding MarR family transcriptional regulator
MRTAASNRARAPRAAPRLSGARPAPATSPCEPAIASLEDPSPPGGRGVAPHGADRLLGFARTLYGLRRRRSAELGSVFADPAWDIFLDLYIAERTGRLVSVSSACIAADTPPSTALRWIRHLEQAGYILRTHDPVDRRRSHLGLSRDTFKAMERLLGHGLTILACSLSRSIA